MSRIKGITIELDGDTKGLDKALSDVNKRSTDVTKELRQVERLLKFNPGNTELVAQKQKLLGDQIETTREKLDKLKEAEAQVQEQFEKGEISEEQYRAFQREIVETESKLKHYEGQLEQTKSKLEKFGEATEKAGEKFKAAGEKLTKTGKDLSKKVTAPLVGAAAIATKVGMDFEAGMSKVAAISGATGKDLEDLTETAREWGSSTSFSATEAAAGMEKLALAGWDTGQIMEGLGSVLHLAEAGNIDLDRSAELVTNSMAGLGIEVKDLEGYLDKVATTAANADTDIDQLMEGFITAGSTFDRLNVPLEESTALLGVMANKGFKASEAGTAINAIMSRLTKETGPAADELEKMGIKVFDTEGNFRGLETVLTEVSQGMAEMTDEQRENALTQIAGLNHGKSFNAMLDVTSDKYTDLKEKVSDSNGALENMRDIMKDNLKGNLESMKSSLEEVAIVIYFNLKPALELLVELISKAAEWFQNLSPAMQNTLVVIAGIAAAIGPLLIIFGMMANGIGSILLMISKLTPIFAKLVPLFKVVGAAIAGISAPVWGIIAAIAALIAIGVLVWKNWDVISEKAVEIWGTISEFFVELWEGIKEVFITAGEFLAEKLMGYWDAISEGVFEVWDGITEFFTNIWEIIKNIFVGAFLVLMLLISGQWEEIGEVTGEIWENIKEAFVNIWESIKQIFSGALSVIVGYATEHWENIKEIFGVALEWLDSKTGGKFSDIVQIVKEYMTMVWDNIKAVWDFIKNTFTNVLNFLKALVTGDFQGMKDAINDQMENARNLIETIWGNVKTFLSGILGDILQAIKDKFSDVVTSVAEKMLETYKSIKDIWDDVMSFLRGIDLTQIGKDMIQGMIDGIKSMGTELVKSAKGVVDDAVQGAKNLLKIASPSKVFTEMGEQTGQGLVVGMNSMGKRVKDAGDRMAAASITDAPKPDDKNNNNGNNGMADILNAILALAERDVVINIDGKEFIKATAPGMSKEINNLNNKGARSQGVVQL